MKSPAQAGLFAVRGQGPAGEAAVACYNAGAKTPGLFMNKVTAIRIARPMQLSETHLVIDYFLNATPEYLNGLGVDPTRVPDRSAWQARFEQQFALPLEQRKIVLVLWELDGRPAGFSSSDKIRLGDEAYMHLHVLEPERRNKGNGAIFVRQTARLYFEMLNLKRLYCEPYALNVAPNRTLQKAGFKYVKTHETVPGPMNFHQPVTRWMIERGQVV
jgi:RimJ/RimL family protein N-acetyltransferase